MRLLKTTSTILLGLYGLWKLQDQISKTSTARSNAQPQPAEADSLGSFKAGQPEFGTQGRTEDQSESQNTFPNEAPLQLTAEETEPPYLQNNLQEVPTAENPFPKGNPTVMPTGPAPGG